MPRWFLDFEIGNAPRPPGSAGHDSPCPGRRRFRQAGLSVERGLETADSALLEAAMNEPLHEPYRIPLIPEYEGPAAVRQSGSGRGDDQRLGPTLLALFLDTPSGSGFDIET